MKRRTDHQWHIDLPLRRSLAPAVLLVALAAVPAMGQSAADHVAMGIAARNALDARTALVHFEAALAVDSTDYQANWQAAISLIDIGAETPDDVPSSARDSLYARAELLARRATETRPEGADGHFALANAIGRVALTASAREKIRRASEVRLEAMKAIQLDPRHDGAYHVLGRWHAEVMRLSGATRFLARTFLGGGVLGEASWDAAIANLERAVELNPDRIIHRLDLAEIYLDVDREADARTQLERIAQLTPRDPGDPESKRRAAERLAALAPEG